MVFSAYAMFKARSGTERTEPLTATSPDGNLSVAFELKANPQPYLSGERAYYRVSYKGSLVFADSPLGLDFKCARALDRDFEIVGSDRQSRDSTWENAFGDQRKVRDHYNSSPCPCASAWRQAAAWPWL